MKLIDGKEVAWESVPDGVEDLFVDNVAGLDSVGDKWHHMVKCDSVRFQRFCTVTTDGQIDVAEEGSHSAKELKHHGIHVAKINFFEVSNVNWQFRFRNRVIHWIPPFN